MKLPEFTLHLQNLSLTGGAMKDYMVHFQNFKIENSDFFGVLASFGAPLVPKHHM